MRSSCASASGVVWAACYVSSLVERAVCLLGAAGFAVKIGAVIGTFGVSAKKVEVDETTVVRDWLKLGRYERSILDREGCWEREEGCYHM